MNILQVIPSFAPAFEFGGPVKGIYDNSKMLIKMGHKVTVYTTDTFGIKGRIDSKEDIIEGIQVKRFRNLSNSLAFRHNVYLPMNMFHEIRKDIVAFDIIHLNEYRTFQNLVVQHYANKYGIPYLVQAHGSLTRLKPMSQLKIIYDQLYGFRLLQNAAKVLALSGLESSQYSNMGVSSNNIVRTSLGLDLTEFENLPERGRFRQKWGIAQNERIVLFLARIDKIKGLDILIEAFNELLPKVKNIKLVIVGPDSGYLSTIKKNIDLLGINDKVMLIGPLFQRSKLEAFVDADVYVLPSAYEIFGISVLEAMACGIPIIITDRCGLADVVDGKSGIVIKYDKDALGSAISWILSDENKSKEYGITGKLLVKNKFQCAKISEQIEKIYLNCLTTKN